jgi:hypothetical protein
MPAHICFGVSAAASSLPHDMYEQRQSGAKSFGYGKELTSTMHWLCKWTLSND